MKEQQSSTILIITKSNQFSSIKRLKIQALGFVLASYAIYKLFINSVKVYPHHAKTPILTLGVCSTT